MISAHYSHRGIYRDKGVAASLLSPWHNGRRRRAPFIVKDIMEQRRGFSTGLCTRDLWFLLFRGIMVQGYRGASSHKPSAFRLSERIATCRKARSLGCFISLIFNRGTFDIHLFKNLLILINKIFDFVLTSSCSFL